MDLVYLDMIQLHIKSLNGFHLNISDVHYGFTIISPLKDHRKKKRQSDFNFSSILNSIFLDDPFVIVVITLDRLSLNYGVSDLNTKPWPSTR